MFEKNKKLNEKIDKLIKMIEKSNIEEWSYVLGSKWVILGRNFIAGISRGIGIGIGVSVITAILILIARHLVALNIPIIGEYISDIVEIVEKSR